MAVVKAGFPEKLQFDSDDADCKMSGFLVPADALMLLWLCYIMAWNSKDLESFGGKGYHHGLPDLRHLVLSAVSWSGEVGSDFNPWDFDILGTNVQLPAANILMWALKTVPSLPDCFMQYVHGSIEKSFRSEKMQPSCSAVPDRSPGVECHNDLLNQGRAWAISLTLRSTLRGEMMKAYFPSYGGGTNESLVYWSSLHGKGLNRFWSNVEGKEKNFVYIHLHPKGRVYDPHPKPVGVAFGGSVGSERIFIDEDFAKVTVHHHAADKTYQPGSLFPNQGFLPVEALILDVEVWGLAGETAKEVQTSYKKREQLFTEQRRKVDLKTFGNWEDAPEKMMMDMVSDPHRVKREDR
ncbi:hypothetical protein RHMOL_Rhmol06G0032000 [Rhododendron molle]|uniref:Uncharacterized protein n=4 Tax=Rhododendron molle TaxID=49168 RepID=A0ACC0N9Q4_RHOML|nr:hypothetical protein RHMOL_Rhmol06G0032000 [Rhododendron molle]KAI8549535.1 hypothetical protein RHMOL_Rhmol06G0032000 [Rhododendron molle]KAI8549536.1 hypothetical protein RHMOL_Rhmol06G0032000 [Rhododendron molle]KAI8549537.1 hypothetical protein RHMOL_Rhmol06G0032000 [Rhododendron molle]